MSFSSIIERQPKRKTIRSAYKQIKLRLGIGMTLQNPLNLSD